MYDVNGMRAYDKKDIRIPTFMIIEAIKTARAF